MGVPWKALNVSRKRATLDPSAKLSHRAIVGILWEYWRGRSFAEPWAFHDRCLASVVHLVLLLHRKARRGRRGDAKPADALPDFLVRWRPTLGLKTRAPKGARAAILSPCPPSRETGTAGPSERRGTAAAPRVRPVT